MMLTTYVLNPVEPISDSKMWDMKSLAYFLGGGRVHLLCILKYLYVN